MNNYAYNNQYTQIQINNSSKEQILVMLYDGLLRFIKMICLSIENNDLEAKGYYINKSIAILTELTCALDRNSNMALAENLGNIYDFCVNALTQANITNNTAILHDIIKVLKPIHEAWKEAATTITHKPAVQETRRSLEVVG